MGIPLLYSISSLKSMTDMRGSSDFCLREGGGGGGAGQNLAEKGFVNFFVLKLIFSGFNVLNLFTEDSTVTFKDNCTFWFQRGSNIFQGWGSNIVACIFPIELVIFKVSPCHLPPPPPPLPHQPPLWVRA